jgi:hypothetical protein
VHSVHAVHAVCKRRMRKTCQGMSRSRWRETDDSDPAFGEPRLIPASEVDEKSIAPPEPASQLCPGAGVTRSALWSDLRG